MSFGAPSVRTPVQPAAIPTRASFVSRGTQGQPQPRLQAGLFRNPVTGQSRSRTGRPSLLGGST